MIVTEHVLVIHILAGNVVAEACRIKAVTHKRVVRQRHRIKLCGCDRIDCAGVADRQQVN